MKLKKHDGGNDSEVWIHPDLAIRLAQWVSPNFALQVSRYVRELAITGSVEIDDEKTDAELIALQEHSAI